MGGGIRRNVSFLEGVGGKDVDGERASLITSGSWAGEQMPGKALLACGSPEHNRDLVR